RLAGDRAQLLGTVPGPSAGRFPTFGGGSARRGLAGCQLGTCSERPATIAGSFVRTDREDRRQVSGERIRVFIAGNIYVKRAQVRRVLQADGDEGVRGGET